MSCGSITISGAASVTAKASNGGAGIGGGNGTSCGDITISGTARVTATGGERAAGIGSGKRKATCGNISISGDCTVTAQGGGNAAGIGCGQGSDERKSECGAITIEDGGNFTSVTAIRGQGALRPIGHSSFDSNFNTCGTITFGENEIYTAGDDPGDYSIDGISGFEETTTDLGGGEDYTDNTWKLWR